MLSKKINQLSLGFLFFISHLGLAQTAELEPNDDCSTGTFIDQGYGIYDGQLTTADTDRDFWIIPVTVPEGSIRIRIRDKSTDEGLAPPMLTLIDWTALDSNLGAIDPCSTQGRTETLVFDSETQEQEISWTTSQKIIYIRLEVYADFLGSLVTPPYTYSIEFVSGDQPLDGTRPTVPGLAPGTVESPNLWLNASTGISKNGNDLATWTDETGTNSFSINGAPKVTENAVNFNSAVNFSNVTESGMPENSMTGSDSITAVEVFGVFKYKSLTEQGTILGETSGFGAVFAGLLNGLKTNDGDVSADPTYGNDQLFSNQNLSTKFSISNIDVGPSIANSYINGLATSVSQEFGNDFSSINLNVPVIGGTGLNYTKLNGDLAELIVYPNSLSSSDRLKVQSYLAIKYGITLDPSVGQYLSPDDDVIWNFTNYWNDVFGVGRKTLSKLSQVSSQSINTVDEDGNGLPGAGNLVIANPSSLGEGEFLVVGNNGQAATFSQNTSDIYRRLGRTWKVNQTGNVGTVDLKFDLNGITVSGSTSIDFAMLIDADGDGNFETGTITRKNANNFRGGVLEFNSVTLPDNSTFSFAEIVPETGESSANRIIVNPSFETGPGIKGGMLNSQSAGALAEIDGWFSTHPNHLQGSKLLIGPVEMWINANQGVDSQDGTYFVELNAWEPSRLYQNVFLVNGETFDWEYHHRKRQFNANPNPDKVQFNLYALDGTKALVIDDYENADFDNWTTRSGTNTINIPTGIYQIGFEAIDNGNAQQAVGNFLDNVTIGLKAFVEFSADTIRISESDQIAPYFYVNGQVQTASSFTVAVNAGSAVEGTDYRFGNKTKSIPVGNYSLADSIALDFAIIDNNIPENDRTIVLSISGTTGDVDRRDANADDVYQQTLVVIIEDDDPCPDPGLDNTFTTCAAGAPALDFMDLLAGTPESGGSWSDLDGSGVAISDPSSVDVSGLLEGTYRFEYSIVSTGICPVETATLTIQIANPNPAGENNSISVCNNETLVDLFANLGGSPVGGGSWIQEVASTIDLTDPSAVSFSGASAGDYTFTYVIRDQLTCNGKRGLAYARLFVTVSDGPNSGTDATVNECTDTPLNLFTSLGGSPDSGGSWSETTSSGADISDPTSVDFSTIAAGSYDFVYTLNGTGGCTTVTATVTVNVDTPHDAGTNNSVSICDDGTTIDLFANLGGTPDPGGSWADTDASGVDLSDPSAISFSGLAAGNYDFTYTLTGNGGCVDQSSVLTVTVVEGVNSGTKNTINICDGGSSTVVDLFASLKGSPDVGGSWTETGTNKSGASLTNPNAVDFDGITGGVYTFRYVVAATAPCANDTTFLTLKVNQDLNPGSNTRIETCNESGVVLDLFGSLSGSPDAGGSWTETSSISSGVPLTDPANVDFSGVPAGDYEFTYDLTGQGVCGDKSSILYVKVNEAIDAGSDYSFSICNGGTTPINLFDSLGGTPDLGGIWLDIDNSGVNLTNGIVGFAGVAPGTYEFRYLVSDPSSCSPKSSTLTVTIGEQPTAGLDGHVVVCDGGSGTIRNLFAAIGGSPDSGGNWSDMDGAGVTLGDGTAIDFNAVPAGTYEFTYTVAGTGGCSAESSSVHVIVNQDPNAGTNTSKTYCGILNTINLLDELDGSPNPGGTWTLSSGTGLDISNPASVSLVPGNYVLTYSLNGEGACADVSSTLTLNVESYASAGESGNTILVCSDAGVIDIRDLLGASADLGGTYNDDDNSGVDLTDPTAVSFAGVAAGDYDFTYTVSNSCGSVSATNTVTVSAPGDAGENAIVSICNNETAFNLFAALGGTPDTGGFWSDNNQTGVTIGDGSSVDFSGTKKGDYRFTYQIQNGSCNVDAAHVDITIEGSPYAGIDNTVLICDTGDQVVDFTSALSLNSSLTQEWSDDNSLGLDLSSPSAVDFSGVANGRYTFTHTASASSACTAASAVLTVVVNESGNAGTDGGTGICAGQVIDLTNLLGTFDAGGTWSDDNNAGVDLFDPTNVDFTGVSAGTYEFTYSLDATSGCSNGSSATVTLTVDDLASTGEANSISVCDASNLDLFASLGGTPDTGGTWSEITSSGVNLSDPTNVDFSAVANGRYEFEYEQGSAGCGTVAVQLLVTVGETIDAGTDTSIEVCNDDSLYDLSSILGNPDQGGTWADTDDSGIDLSNPNTVSFENVSAGVYRITHSHAGSNGCNSSSAVLTVQVDDKPDAGQSAIQSFCSIEGPIDLFSLLNGTPDTNGSWVDLDASGVDLSNPNNVDISVLSSGDYQFSYVVKSAGVCSGASATVSLSISESPTASITENEVTVCKSPGASFDLTSNLTAGYTTGGVWTVDGKAVANPSQFDISSLETGLLSVEYSINATGACAPFSAQYVLNIETGVHAGSENQSLTICTTESSSVNLAALFGPKDEGGTYSDIDGTGVDLSDPGSIDFSGITAGSYDFSYLVSNDCNTDESTNTIVIIEIANAGTDNAVEVCTDESGFDLFAALEGTPDTGGTWEDLNNSGVDLTNPQSVSFKKVEKGTYRFSYQVGTPACAVDIAFVDVTINGPSYSGIDQTVVLCAAGSKVVDFNHSIGINSSLSTEWTDNNSAGVDLSDLTQIDFAGISAGSYSFTHTLSDDSGCGAQSANLVVKVDQAANAGTDGSISACSDATIDLSAVLGTFDAGGNWSDDNNLGVDLSDPAQVSFSSIAAGSYTFTYTVSGVDGCSGGSAQVTVTIEEPLSAGADNTISICDGSTVDLFSSLIGAPVGGGSWTESTSSGVDISDPSNVDFSGIAAGAYEFVYTVSNAQCGSQSAQLVVNVNQEAQTGTSSQINVCNSGATYDLFQHLSGADPGGSWQDMDNSGIDLSNPSKVSFTGIPAATYRFSYTLFGQNGCNDVSSILTASVNEAPFAGIDNTISLCSEGANVIDLTASLLGNPDANGSWTETNDTGIDLSDPGKVDLSGLAIGTYHFSYTVSSSGICSSDVAHLVVEIIAPIDAGSSNTVTIGKDDPTYIDLFTSLAGTPATGGSWFEMSNSGVNLSRPDSVDFREAENGNYTFVYETDANAVCSAGSSTITVIVDLGASASEIIPVEGFSPNGDGINDSWQIPYIDQYPNNEVNIYNRWGQLVFTMKGYDNNTRTFLGKANNGSTLGTYLADGTYFYVISLGDDLDIKKGYITLTK